MTPHEMAEMYAQLLDDYPIILLEDPFAEDDWESWTAFMKTIKGKVEVVGDDLLCTQVKRVEMAHQRAACDGLLLKVRPRFDFCAHHSRRSIKWEPLVKLSRRESGCQIVTLTTAAQN